jgi:hypothetical protein
LVLRRLDGLDEEVHSIGMRLNGPASDFYLHGPEKRLLQEPLIHKLFQYNEFVEGGPAWPSMTRAAAVMFA